LPIETILINLKIPIDFSMDSIDLLKMISENEHDEILNLDVVVLFLKRKWDTFAFPFFLIQLIGFSIFLVALTIEETGIDKTVNIDLKKIVSDDWITIDDVN